MNKTPAQAAEQLFPEPQGRGLLELGLNLHTVERYDFLPHLRFRCTCCGQRLRSGRGFVLNVNGALRAAGPECTSKLASDSGRPIPNLTRGIRRSYDKETDPASDLNDPSARGGAPLLRRNWRLEERVRSYCLMREHILPHMGVPQVAGFGPVARLHQAFQKRRPPTRAMIDPVIKTMRGDKTPKHLRYGSLLAVHSFLSLSQQALRESGVRSALLEKAREKNAARTEQGKPPLKTAARLPLPLGPRDAMTLQSMCTDIRRFYDESLPKTQRGQFGLSPAQLDYAEDIIRRMFPPRLKPRLKKELLMREVRLPVAVRAALPKPKPAPVSEKGLPRFKRTAPAPKAAP